MDDPTRLISTLTLLIAVTAIMTALMEGELEHRDRAVLDPLTGLLNRASLDARVLEIEEQAHLTGGAVSLILLDLDGFKRVNDTYGHKRGDAVLSDVAYEIRKSLRSFELVYRIGGEEFLVLLPGVDLAEALDIGERLRTPCRRRGPAGWISRCRRAWPRPRAGRSGTRSCSGRRTRPCSRPSAPVATGW